MTRHISLRRGLGAIGIAGALIAAIAPTALASTAPPDGSTGTEAAATEAAAGTEAVAGTEAAAGTEATAGTEAVAGSEAPAGSATSVDLDALTAAANEEGQVNLIALPPTWANYQGVIDSFNEKYPDIETPVQSPGASSAEELVAVDTQRDSDTMPDVLDVSPAIALQAIDEGYFDTFSLSQDAEIPAALRDPDGHWVASYYGVIAFGVNTTIVTDYQPTSFADLTSAPANSVSLNGDPREAGAAFAGVMAASLANGGSFDDIMPGIQYYADLAAAGIFNPTAADESTVLSGETPIVIDWSYNFPGLIPAVEDAGFTYFTTFPSDAVYAAYYCQGPVAGGPNPNAARLWLEHLVSDEAALAFLEGGAIPARFPTLVENGTITEEMQANLPPAELIADVSFMNDEQLAAANAALVENWGPMVLGS